MLLQFNCIFFSFLLEKQNYFSNNFFFFAYIYIIFELEKEIGLIHIYYYYFFNYYLHDNRNGKELQKLFRKTMSYVNFSHTTAEVQDGDDVLHLDEKMETQDIEDKFEKIINRFNRLKSQKQVRKKSNLTK